MKKVLVFILCLSVFPLLKGENSGTQKNVKGSGKVVNKLRKVDPFQKIDISGVFDVYLIQGNEELIRIELDDNLHQYVLTRVEGNTLKIRITEDINFRNPAKNNIYITLRDIDELSIGGVCDVNTNGKLMLDYLKVKTGGVSDINMNIDCNQLEVKAFGVGDCVFKGNAKILTIVSSGTRDINARNLISEKATVSKSGVGDVTVHVTGEIDINSSGTGDVTYYGNPVIKSLNKSGVGDIIKRQ